MSFAFAQFASHAGASDGMQMVSLMERLHAAQPYVVLADGKTAGTEIRVMSDRNGSASRLTVTNTSDHAISVREVVIADVDHGFAPETPVFGEGFQKLGMNGGTFGKPVDLGSCYDPDTVLLREPKAKNIMGPAGELVSTGKITEGEYRFHVASIYAAGGSILSGDDLTHEVPRRVALLQKLLPPTGVAARYENEQFEVGRIELNGKTVYAVFNPTDQPAQRMLYLAAKSTLRDLLIDTDLGAAEEDFVVPSLAGHDAMMVEATPVSN